jgi:hypothetical protein
MRCPFAQIQSLTETVERLERTVLLVLNVSKETNAGIHNLGKAGGAKPVDLAGLVSKLSPAPKVPHRLLLLLST